MRSIKARIITLTGLCSTKVAKTSASIGIPPANNEDISTLAPLFFYLTDLTPRQESLISSNTFDGMAQELPKYRYQVDPKPNAFTEEERDQVIEAFKNDARKGMNYRRYAPFVEFLFCVGCRPSEAIGLRWKHISDDFGTIHFEESLVQIGNRRVRSEGSKNNTTRTIAISHRVQELLKGIAPEVMDPGALVFTGKGGDSISYRNFSRRAWTQITTPIKPDTTPYSCRDTFITTQLIKGVPSSVIAKWCDTSTQPEFLTTPVGYR
jgi:integrase